MTVGLTTYVIRGPRRIRLLFGGALGAGAFTSTTYYAVSTADGMSSMPYVVNAAFAIASNSASVELEVSQDWIPGALYTIAVTAVPLSPSGTATDSLVASIPLPAQAQTTQLANIEPETNDLALLLYNRDLVFDFGGTGDFIETPGGDLGTVSGRTNWQGAMNRRMASAGLPWQPSYGPDAQDFVDAPAAYAMPLAGRLLGQARADNRTKSASISVSEQPGPDALGSAFVFTMNIVGVDGLETITTQTQAPTSS